MARFDLGRIQNLAFQIDLEIFEFFALTDDLRI